MGPQASPTVVAGLALRWHWLRAPGASGSDEEAVGLWVLDDPDELLDRITQEEFERLDERMPYFGAIWPSAESLVARILLGPRLDGRDVLELGCGLGACGFAAARRGAHVTFLDWEPRALEIVEASALEQGLPLSAFDLVVADWRRPPRMGPFDLVLGADVLYEERNAPAVADFLAAHLKPGAEAWITDPGRPHARRFPALAKRCGLDYLGGELLPPKPHGLKITLLRLRRPLQDAGEEARRLPAPP
jgi:predicted nicotinamide N-methyase